MNLITVVHYRVLGPCDTDDIFKVMGSKAKVADNIFGQFTFSVEAYLLVHNRLVFISIVMLIIFLMF